MRALKFFDWKFFAALACCGMILVVISAQINANQALRTRDSTATRSSARITELNKALADANNKIQALQKGQK